MTAIEKLIKRLFDIFFGLIGVIILIPLIILIKILYIKNKDYGSIFYKQKRIGLNGKEFDLYKFRTMVPNADKILKEVLESDEKLMKEWKEFQKLDKDPRITPAGKILRKSSLDEMPQFINVLKGDMSLIGPRPLVPGEVELHNGNKKKYESIRPGITSWWAANGRSAKNYDDRLNLEYYYIDNQSLILDIRCIFLTAYAIMLREGSK